MEKKIEQLRGWVEELTQAEHQTPYLHVAVGGLRTAIGNMLEHLKVPVPPAPPESKPEPTVAFPTVNGAVK